MGALVFLLRPEEFAALAAAVTAHELGHVLALLLLGERLEALVLSATGPVLRTSVPRISLSGVSAALSGPLAGALFWLAFQYVWTLAAEMSFVLTAVNLLPVLPLDGGRALEMALSRCSARETILRLVRVVVLAGLLFLGIRWAAAGWGYAPLLFAFWLMILPSCTCKSGVHDVKYSYSILS